MHVYDNPVRTYESFATLVAELEGDSVELQRVLQHNTRAWDRIEAGANDPVDWGALGFTIHTIYGILENYFLRVSHFFENSLPSDRWHQALVEKMTLDIPDLRPALLTDNEARRDTMEMVRFRHRLRNLYGEDLDSRKTREIQQILTRFVARFPEVHASFVHKLKEIADGI